jgi:hypothetical protein
MDEWVWSNGGMVLTGHNKVLEEKPVLVSFRPAQIPHGLVTTVTGYRPTTGAIARPAK